ncbi:MAG: hypothetical protein ABIO85_05505 [Sphingomicrobium sp.]
MIALVLAASTLPMAPAATPLEHARFAPSGAVASAEIRVRIISGASVTLGRSSDEPGARLRSAIVTVDGSLRPARLVEFQ